MIEDQTVTHGDEFMMVMLYLFRSDAKAALLFAFTSPLPLCHNTHCPAE